MSVLLQLGSGNAGSRQRSCGDAGSSRHHLVSCNSYLPSVPLASSATSLRMTSTTAISSSLQVRQNFTFTCISFLDGPELLTRGWPSRLRRDPRPVERNYALQRSRCHKNTKKVIPEYQAVTR